MNLITSAFSSWFLVSYVKGPAVHSLVQHFCLLLNYKFHETEKGLNSLYLNIWSLFMHRLIFCAADDHWWKQIKIMCCYVFCFKSTFINHLRSRLHIHTCKIICICDENLNTYYKMLENELKIKCMSESSECGAATWGYEDKEQRGGCVTSPISPSHLCWRWGGAMKSLSVGGSDVSQIQMWRSEREESGVQRDKEM